MRLSLPQGLQITPGVRSVLPNLINAARTGVTATEAMRVLRERGLSVGRTSVFRSTYNYYRDLYGETAAVNTRRGNYIPAIHAGSFLPVHGASTHRYRAMLRLTAADGQERWITVGTDDDRLTLSDWRSRALEIANSQRYLQNDNQFPSGGWQEAEWEQGTFYLDLR